MPTFSQITRLPRNKKIKNSTSSKLQRNPQKQGVCLRVLTMTPKKPNSANRRVIRIIVTHYKTRLTAKIAGESHNLQQHSTVLVKGARIHDLIGVNYAAVRGKYDLLGVASRKTKRSLFGVKKNV
jgi:small subunit ribosomal protein S12